MAAQAQRRSEDFLKEENAFRRNAFLLIDKMLELVERAVREDRRARDDVTALVDEIIHSIFFLGKINSPPFSPDEILGDVQDALKDSFPRPFQLFTSQLPRRNPFSCVLDMIVHLNGGNEDRIIDGLRRLIIDLGLSQSKHLVSSTICVSQNDNDPVKYYGVSISAADKMPRKIMIAASCLGSWDRYVAGAVMTYFPTQRTDFDGTIRLPEGVRCQAFSLRNNERMLPCALCKQLFGLTPFSENARWVHGNCAEVESLSNLFDNVDETRKRAWLTSAINDVSRRRAEQAVRTVLTESVRQRQFRWDDAFYTPQ